VDYFNVKVRDIWEGDVMMRTEIETENICSQMFGCKRASDITEGKVCISVWLEFFGGLL
jgi:hypothetical protein